MFIPLISFGQVDIDKETKETINWLNSKLSTYSLKLNDVCYNFALSHIGIQTSDNGVLKQGTLYLYCAQEEDVYDFGIEIDYLVGLPIMKINSIRFQEYKSSYHIIFNTVVNSKVIAIKDMWDDNKSRQVSDLHVFLSKSLENEELKPRILKAFYYLFELHGNDLSKTEKF